MSVTAVTPPLYRNNLPLETPPPTWEELLPAYIELSLEYATNPNDSDLRSKFEKQFRMLRTLNPKSFVPFYPIFLYHLTILDQDQLRELIKEGKEVDSHLTFVFCLHSLSSESVEIRSQIVHIYQILLRAYPDDALLPAMLFTLVKGGDKFELKLAGATKDLSRACRCLAQKESSRALLILMNESKRAPGQAIFQPWLAMAWALKGNYSAARLALSRMSTSVNSKFFSDFAQHIMVSHLNFDSEQDFTRFNLLNSPFKRQIEGFITLLETKPFNEKLALNFIETSTEAFQNASESLAFLYFGLEYILDNINCYEPELANLYRKIYNISQSAIEFCYQSEQPDPWILQHCAVMDNQIRMPLIQDARNTLPITPSFQFNNAYGITDASHHSLAAAIANQGCRLMGKIFDLSIATQGLELDLPLVLPPSQTSFEEYCNTALLAENPTDFCTAITYLRHYLEIPEESRPFKLSEEFLKRAKFLIFTSAPLNKLDHSLDKQIKETYYPSQFTLRQLQLTQKQVMSCFSEKSHSPIPLAARDVLLAKMEIESQDAAPADPLSTDPYTLYLQSKKYFRWRPNETLIEWQTRLKTQNYPSNSFFDILNQLWTEFIPKPKIQIPAAIFEKIKKKMVPNGVQPRQAVVKCAKVAQKPTAPPLPPKPFNMVNEKLEVIAATLFACAENHVVRPVSVKDEPQAIDLCRLVLETSADRLIRKVLSMEESADPDTLKILIELYLSPLLATCSYNQVTKCYRVPIATQSGIVRYRNIYVGK